MVQEMTDTQSDMTPSTREEKIFVASQRQLVWWRFRKHKLALISGVVLLLAYLVVIFAEFVAPYDPHMNRLGYMLAPPQKLHFVDEAGRFHLVPFTYALTMERDMETLVRSYVEDTSQRYPLRLFVKGEPYELWGLFPSELHLFGTTPGGTMFLLGTDGQGRDMVSRIIHGARISMSVGLVGIFISFMLGITLGGFSGYYGGTFDLLLQRTIEFIRSVPRLPLWIALSAALPPQWSMIRVYFGIVVILSLLGWTGLARVVRSKFLSLREEDFVMAARLGGATEGRIVFRHMVPSFSSHLIASLTLQVPGMILGETSLSFIGLGLQPPALSWGVLLKDAQTIRVLSQAPWLLIPGIPVVLAVLAFSFLGDGLRDAADPYSR